VAVNPPISYASESERLATELALSACGGGSKGQEAKEDVSVIFLYRERMSEGVVEAVVDASARLKDST
jgi:hypothetical protein